MIASKEIEFVVDEEKEEATLRVADVVYQILFDYDSIILFFRVFGINPLFESIGRDPAHVSTLLWAGLLHFHPDLREQPAIVNSWFTSPAAALKLVDGVFKAFKLSLPKPDPKEVSAPSDPPSA